MRQVISIQSRVHSSGVPACWKSNVPLAWNISWRLSNITYLYVCTCIRYVSCMSLFEYNKYDAHVCYDILRHVYD